MKKAIAVTLAAVFFVSALVLFVPAASGMSDPCTERWKACRRSAFEADEGWLRTTLMLTVCDIGWGKCELML